MSALASRLKRLEKEERVARLWDTQDRFHQILATLSDAVATRAILVWGDLPEGAYHPVLELAPEDAQAWEAFCSSGAWQAALDYCEIVEETPAAEWDRHISSFLNDYRYHERLPQLKSYAYALGHR